MLSRARRCLLSGFPTKEFFPPAQCHLNTKKYSATFCSSPSVRQCARTQKAAEQRPDNRRRVLFLSVAQHSFSYSRVLQSSVCVFWESFRLIPLKLDEEQKGRRAFLPTTTQRRETKKSELLLKESLCGGCCWWCGGARSG